MSIDTSKLESVAAAIVDGRPTAPEVRKQAIERLKKLQKSLRDRMGTVDLVVPALRSTRDE